MPDTIVKGSSRNWNGSEWVVHYLKTSADLVQYVEYGSGTKYYKGVVDTQYLTINGQHFTWDGTNKHWSGIVLDGSNIYLSGSSGTTLAQAIADASRAGENVYQPLDADLTAIAGLTGTNGFLKKTAANTWTLDTTAYATSSALTTHTSSTSNPHSVTKAQVGLGSVVDQGMDDSPTSGSAKYVKSGGVYSALAGKQDTINASNKLSASFISGLPTSLPASNTTNTYSSTGTEPVSGKAVASAISGKQDTINASNKLSASFISGLPTSLPASNVTDTYSSTGTEPVSGKAVASAISGKVDTTRTINNKDLSSDITLTAEDIKMGPHVKFLLDNYLDIDNDSTIIDALNSTINLAEGKTTAYAISSSKFDAQSSSVPSGHTAINDQLDVSITSSTVSTLAINDISCKGILVVGSNGNRINYNDKFVNLSDMKQGDIIYTEDRTIADWFVMSKDDNQGIMLLGVIDADKPNLSGYQTKITSTNKLSYDLLSGAPSSLPASNVTDTYSSTGTAPVSGKAVASAISGKQDTINASNKLSASFISGLPTSLPASNTTNTYSSTGTEPVSGQAVASAISGFNKISVGASAPQNPSVGDWWIDTNI